MKESGNIVLVGFMGVGKGRTARELSAHTGNFAVDTDDMIESLAKKKIRKIFADEGEVAFRKMEQQAASWLKQNVSNTIVSTGGGFFMVKNIHKLGKVIYLHASVEHIIAAMKSHPNGARKIKKRPLLQDLKAAKKLYDKRLPLYRHVADYEINVEGKSTGAVAREIVDLLHLKKK